MPAKPLPFAEHARRKAAVKACNGSLSAAARLLKISRSALREWAAGAYPPDQQPVYTPPASTPMEVTEHAAQLAELEDALAKAETEKAVLLSELKTARNVVVKEPIKVSHRARDSKDDWVRVIIPDSHGMHIARNAAAAFLADLARLDPDEIVMLGDHCDVGGFLAQHHTMGFVAETEASYADDVRATNDFLNEVQKAAKSVRRIHYCEGNHENRCERWCVTQALRNKKDSQFLLDVFGPRAVLGLKQRGIEYYRMSERYHGLPIPGTIRLGHCHFTHGVSFDKHAAATHAAKFGASVVFGHCHRSMSTVVRSVSEGVIGAWCPGCLTQLQPLYQATSPTDWSHGYGLQIVSRSGKFLHLNVPIIDGESLLSGVHFR